MSDNKYWPTKEAAKALAGGDRCPAEVDFQIGRTEFTARCKEWDVRHREHSMVFAPDGPPGGCVTVSWLVSAKEMEGFRTRATAREPTPPPTDRLAVPSVGA